MNTADTKTHDPQAGRARAKFWLEEIARAGKREADWRKEAREILERYRNEKRKTRGFNILWANTELLKPAVLSRSPQPDVRRRFLQDDPIALTGAELIEKALKFTGDDPRYGFVEMLEAARDDMLLTGRGVVRVAYDREIRRIPLRAAEVPDEAGLATRTLFMTEAGAVVEPDEFDKDGNPFRLEIAAQDVYCKYVYWEDYREGDARAWEDVPWIAYRHTLTRKQLKEQFGDVGKLVPLNARTKDRQASGRGEGDQGDPESPLDQAIVWEVWDRDARERVWVADGFNDDVLDVEDDPLKLENFFPQPAPLYAVNSTATRVPVPEFRQYRDQADELNEISMRITRLIKALKVRGAYAGVMKELADILNGDENELYPIEDWAALQDMGGLDKAVMWLPLETIAGVLAGLYKQRGELKAEIFELTGLSDIVRGTSDPRETRGAQEIKANFGTVRMTPRQRPIERFVRQIFQIKGEIIAEHFTAGHLLAMTGVEPPSRGQAAGWAVRGGTPQSVQPGAGVPQPATMDQVMALLRSDKLRKFTIDIESDSTVQVDAQREQSNVIEFLSVSTQFITSAAQAAQQSPAMVPLFLEMYKTAARRFKMGRELEGIIDDTMSNVLGLLAQAQQQQAQAVAQPPQPDPQAAFLQAETARKNAEFQAEQARMNAKLTAELQRLQKEMDTKLALKAQESEAKIALRAQEDSECAPAVGL